VHVTCDGDEVETWGSAEEWREDLVTILRDQFRVSEVIFHSGAGDPAEADVNLEIRVIPISARKAEVESSAAVLDVLAYVTIPLLPLWIRDVRKYAGVKLELTVSYVCAHNEGESPIKDTIEDVPGLLTSLLERSSVFSWTTLGAILVPPFVFEGEDRSEHMKAAMGPRVRRLAAAAVAYSLKQLRVHSEELIWDVQLRQGPEGPVLSFEVHPNVGAFTIRAADMRINESLALDRQKPEHKSYRLVRSAHVARIEVESLAFPPVVRCYTVKLDDKDKDEDETGAS